MSACWILQPLGLSSHQHGFLTKRVVPCPSSRPVAGNVIYRRRRVTLDMSSTPSGEDEDNANDSDSEKGKDNDDLNEKWSEFSKSRTGGVFQFSQSATDEGIDNTKNQTKPMVDDQTDKLVSIWSSENGFLFAIVGLFFIFLFYIYTYVSGGIPH